MDKHRKKICSTQKEAFDPNHPIHKEYPWIPLVLADLTQTLSNQKEFPCTFARHAFKADQLHYLFAGSPFDRDARYRIRQGLLQYLEHMDGLSGIEESMQALIVFFEPDDSPLSADGYHQRAWMIMQDWIDHDPKPWPQDIPLNPSSPFWSLCFRGVPLFVNVSSPAHEIRRSRNIGRSLALITQPRAGFDRVAGNTVKGNKIRHLIRELMHEYDGIPAPGELGTYHRGDLEWWQYTLQETNVTRRDRCPLKMK
jgi:FPC/CPF motif-containing protein YcgG